MTHRLVRGVAGATPQGARCVELRLKPQLKANLPRWSVPIGRTRLCRGAADAPVASPCKDGRRPWRERRPRHPSEDVERVRATRARLSEGDRPSTLRHSRPVRNGSKLGMVRPPTHPWAQCTRAPEVWRALRAVLAAVAHLTRWSRTRACAPAADCRPCMRLVQSPLL